MSRMAILRAGLVIFAGFETALGAWQMFLPESFFAIPWVSYLPPYNEHLMTDVGGLNLALSVVVWWAAITLSRDVVRAALVALIVYAGTHFAFHAGHLQAFPTADAVAQTISLGAVVVVPLVLLWLARDLAPPADRQTGAR